MTRDAGAERAMTISPARAVALLLILVPTFLRVLLVTDPFPYWDVSPLKFPAPSLGATPFLSLNLDFMAILGAAAAVWIAKRRIHALEALLLAAGGIMAITHAFTSLDNLRLGSSWTSAIAAGIGVRALAADAPTRRWLAAILLGLSMPLAVQSLVQVFIDHPATVASYRANPNAFLEARGWSPGSAMARNYERRLMQPEATGWFGLANVHATFGAAFVIGWAGVLAHALGKPRRADAPSGSRVLLLVCAVLAAAMLFFTRSKGGYGAAAIGLGLMALPLLAARVRGLQGPTNRPARHARWVGPGAMVAVLLALAARGLVGTRLGELSLLFRWFYISAAGRIFADAPLTGTGPADFRPAYELFKNPLSPEEVTSPHCLPFDWLATLGIAGVAWIALVVMWSWRLGPAALRHEDAPEQASTGGHARGISRTMALWTVLAILIPSVHAFIIELAGYAQRMLPGATLEDLALITAQSRVPGTLLWAVASLLVLRLSASERAMNLALGACGVSLLVSSMLDVTPVWPGSAALFFVMLGLCASSGSAAKRDAKSCRWPYRVIASGAIVAVGASFTTDIRAVFDWERALAETGNQAHHAGVLRLRLNAIESGRPMPGDSLAAWQRSANVGGHETFSTLTPREQLAQATLDLVPSHSYSDLAWSLGDSLKHAPTLKAAAEVAFDLAGEARVLGDEMSALRHANEGRDLAAAAAAWDPPSSSAWGWLAQTELALHELSGEPDALNRARAAFERAAALDPHGIAYPLQLFELSRRMRDSEGTRRWGEELLRRNQNFRLDPLRALTPEQVARVEGALRDAE